MGLFGWLKSRSGNGNRDLAEWRQAWRAAADRGPDEAVISDLTSRLDALQAPPDDVEIEREMLEGLSDLLRLRAAAETGGLPVIETGHRVVGADTCHFSAPVSMPEDEAQASGRLLLTATKAIFVGGAKTTILPWHAVGEALHTDRDLVLIKRDREHLYRFRCNSYADALCGAFLSRRLSAARRSASAPRQGGPE